MSSSVNEVTITYSQVVVKIKRANGYPYLNYPVAHDKHFIHVRYNGGSGGAGDDDNDDDVDVGLP